MDKHKMSKEVFLKVRAYIYKHCGIHFSENKIYLLEDRLSGRIDERKLSSYEEYLYFLQYDPKRKEEFKSLYNSITTNETSFFRDPGQLEAFRTGALSMVLDGKNPNDKVLRIWSAGCSTGEEPYTLAIMLVEEGFLKKGWTVEILASDISERVLNSARKAVYPEYAIRNTSPAILGKYFTKTPGGYQVNDDIKKMVRFLNINLFDSTQVRAALTADIIFCRNVIIYFDDDSKRKVMGHFYDRLTDKGILVLGFSETLINLTRAFRPKGISRYVVYQKV